MSFDISCQNGRSTSQVPDSEEGAPSPEWERDLFLLGSTSERAMAIYSVHLENWSRRGLFIQIVHGTPQSAQKNEEEQQLHLRHAAL